MNVIEHIQEAYQELKKEIEYSEKLMEDFEIMGLDKFADSAVIIKARIKTIPCEQWSIKREYYKILKQIFDRKNIEISFPNTRRYWKKHNSDKFISESKNN